MTRTITPAAPDTAPVREPVDDAVTGLTGTTMPTQPSRAPEVSARRRRSVFPTPGQDAPAPGDRPRPTVRWAGSDRALEERVRDHATAVGLHLSQAPADPATVCTVVDAAALTTGPWTRGGGAPPLLVVTGSPEVPATTWTAALSAGARAVLPLPEGSDELLSHLADLARPRSAARVLGVVGGCGGAGASSFAVRLAAAARGHGPVTLVDADPLGGGTDLLVEAPALEGIRWREAAALEAEDGEALRAGLPVVDEVALLVSGEGPGPTEQTLPPVLSALAVQGGTVVVDLSPALVAAAAEHLHRLLVVVPSTDHAVRATVRRLRAWQLPGDLAHAVVRRSGPLTATEVGEDLALPLVASFRDSPRGTVPLLDVRRRGADRAARELMAHLTAEVRA